MSDTSLPTGDYGTSLYNSADSSGESAINSFDPTSTANSFKTGFSDLYGSQTGTINNLTDAYSAAVAKNPSVTSLYDTANTAFNVPTLASNANYLQNQVTNALPTQQGLMRGFDASQGQVDNATNYNLRFLEPQATAATNNLNTAQGLASQYVQAGQAQNAQNLLPIQSQISSTNDAMARQSSGYTVAMQAEMDGLIAKMNQGVALSAAEIDRANTLATAEATYNGVLATNRFKTVDQNQNLYDAFKNVYTNPTIINKGGAITLPA